MLATAELVEEESQAGELGVMLPRLLQEVPLYAAGGHARVYGDGAFDLGRFKRLPLMDKRHIRSGFPGNFLPEGVSLEDLLARDLVELEHTSGTSEQRTPLLLKAGWWGEQERRALGLNRFVAEVLEREPEARRVTIVSPSCSNDIRYTGVPSCGERVVGSALFVALSRFPFLWSPRDLDRMVAEAQSWNPVFLDVDPVYAVPFALHCERRGIRLPRLKFILASYEFLSVVHRRILERVFQVPVFNLYGSTETGHLLMETERGEMRPSLQTAFLEVLEDDPEGIGQLVVTTLTNEFMPLVRYAIGDLVGRREGPYGTAYELHGRASDAVQRTDGRRVTVAELDRCFEGVAGVAHYQLHEPSPGVFRLRYIPETGEMDSEASGELTEPLKALLGEEARITVEPTPGLLAEPSGKFRLSYPHRGN